MLTSQVNNRQLIPKQNGNSVGLNVFHFLKDDVMVGFHSKLILCFIKNKVFDQVIRKICGMRK